MDFKEWNKQIIKEFRDNDGAVGGMFEGKPLVLLHTRGAKTGEPRTNPLMYDTDGDDLVMAASMGGAPRNPDWYHNLLANPDVEVEFGDATKPMRARVAGDEERDRRYAKLADQYPQFADYEQSTDRTIPIVVLSPR